MISQGISLPSLRPVPNLSSYGQALHSRRVQDDIKNFKIQALLQARRDSLRTEVIEDLSITDVTALEGSLSSKEPDDEEEPKSESSKKDAFSLFEDLDPDLYGFMAFEDADAPGQKIDAEKEMGNEELGTGLVDCVSTPRGSDFSDADGEDVVFGLEYEDGRPLDEVDLVYA